MNKSMPTVSQLKIKMSAITLGPIQLDNLASEFYGHIPNISTIDKDIQEISVIFRDLIDPTLKTVALNGAECRNSFRHALDSFKVPSTPAI